LSHGLYGKSIIVSSRSVPGGALAVKVSMEQKAHTTRIEVGVSTHVGRKRDKNEDSFACYTLDGHEMLPTRNGGLFAVADGLGGHMGGEIASKLAVKILGDFFNDPEAPLPVDERLVYLAKKANCRINMSMTQSVQDKPPMATTLTAVHVSNNKATFVNVGDSRAYLIRDGAIHQVTIDHSWVQEQVQQGLMSEEEARRDKRRNLITRTLGTRPEVDVDVFKETLEPNDFIVLCSDGLSNYVKEGSIQTQVVDADSVQDAADGLVRLANERGGRDNITTIVVQIDRPWKDAAAAAVRHTVARSWPTLLRLAALLAVIGAAFLAGYLLKD